MKYTITLTSGNAAFQTEEDLADILTKLAEKIRRGQFPTKIMDFNGNQVGTFREEEDEPEEIEPEEIESYRFVVNEKVSSQTWWDNATASNEYFQQVLRLRMDNHIVMSESAGKKFLQWCQTIPGWQDQLIVEVHYEHGGWERL